MNPGHIIEWLLGLALATAAAAVIAGVVCERFARAGQVIEDARNDVGDDTLEMLDYRPWPGPGPGRPQPSGVSRNDETGIGEWTDAQMAFIRGDTDELPGG